MGIFSSDWWFGDNSLWGELTGKASTARQNKAAAAAEKKRQAFLQRALTEGKKAIGNVGEYTPYKMSEFKYNPSTTVQKRLSMLKDSMLNNTRRNVRASNEAMARRGLINSGLALGMANKLRAQNAESLNRGLTGVQEQDINRAQNLYLTRERAKQIENYRRYMARVQRAQELARLYQSQMGALAGTVTQRQTNSGGGLNDLIKLGATVATII